MHTEAVTAIQRAAVVGKHGDGQGQFDIGLTQRRRGFDERAGLGKVGREGARAFAPVAECGFGQVPDARQ
ncbi:hypothetical protein D3C76_1336630 [compost metagenome]